mgnify:CR=1 FL=1
MSIGDLAPHTELMSNIEGARQENSAKAIAPRAPAPGNNSKANELRAFGVEAISDRVLRVRLRRPDMNFPALVAHPVFRPVKLKDGGGNSKLEASGLISNGAFSLAATESASRTAGARKHLLEQGSGNASASVVRWPEGCGVGTGRIQGR